MKIKITKGFSIKLADQVEYISRDKPQAARKFKKDILGSIGAISSKPIQNRRSIYYEDDNIRELIFKGYKIVYQIIEEENAVKIFGFINQENDLQL